MSGSPNALGPVRMCSIAIGKNTTVSMETGEHNDSKAVRYSVIFDTATGHYTEVSRKSKTDPGWRLVWGKWQNRHFGLKVGQIISEAKRMLAAHLASQAKPGAVAP